MRQIAIYGEDEIGKFAATQNLTPIHQFGYDPKAVSEKMVVEEGGRTPSGGE